MQRPSPFLIGIRKRLTRPFADVEPGYKVFTTAFDQVLSADDLPNFLQWPTAEETQSFDDAVRRFDRGFSAERITIAEAAAALVRSIGEELPADLRAKCVVSFLIDHSGSMRGLRMMSALLAVECTVDALTNVGVATEVLGFTTSSWKGGRSRDAWRWAGKPRNPGRLCDLLHIVYATTGRTAATPWRLRLALRSDLLHENIDGEALQWAASRLDADRWDRRVICILSDGAPVDDSTLLANDDAGILARHLAQVEEALRSEGLTIAYLFLGREHYRQAELWERGDEPEGAGTGLIRLVGRALMPSPLSKSDGP